MMIKKKNVNEKELLARTSTTTDQNKKKKFFRAVDGLSLTVEPNQIFCLLGHNGAGKSTTLNLMDATEPPTSGEIFIAGVDVIRNPKELRATLGVAPQFDICFESVSCIDQLELFGIMAGMSAEQSRSQAESYLMELKLLHKANEIPKRLSGGQKRRLSLIIALMGSPKVLLLDEITTGLDVRVRKSLWKLLHRIKKSCTIIMTTHSMEEAENLGDVIGVLSHGKLQALGSSLELKREYGCGYVLHCLFLKEKDEDDHRLRALVKKYVRKSHEISSLGFSATFALPLHSVKMFPSLFDELEEQSSLLGVVSFGIAPTTLDDVFLALDQGDKVKNDMIKAALNDEAYVSLSSSRRAMAQSYSSLGPTAGADFVSALSAVSGNSSMMPDLGEASNINNHNTSEILVQSSSPPSGFTPFSSFTLKPNAKSQIYAVLVQVLTQSYRKPLSIMYLVFFPVLMTVISGLFSKFSKPAPLVPSILGLNTTSPQIPLVFPSLNEEPTNISQTLFQNFSDPFASNKLNDLVFDLSSKISNLIGIMSILELNSTSQDVKLEIAYNSSIPGSLRSILASVQNSLFTSSSSSDEALQIEFFQLRSIQKQNEFTSGGVTFFIALAFSLLAAFYAEDMVRLRTSRLKDMMLIAGLPRSIFWLSYFLAHFCLLLVSWLLSFFVALAFGMDGVSKTNVFGYIMLFFMFGIANICFGYCISFALSSPNQAQKGLWEPLNLLLAIPWVVVTFALQGVPNPGLENAFSLIPSFALYRGLAILETAAKNENPLSLKDFFLWEKLFIQNLMMLAVSSLIWILLLINLETGGFQQRIKDFMTLLCCNQKREQAMVMSDQEIFKDEDPHLARPVNAMPYVSEGDILPLRVDKLRKSFDHNKFHACKNVSFGVSRGTIFGLLGPNGAGKTTLISCINGVEGTKITSGDASIVGKSVVHDLAHARQHMGVCFQYDALNSHLTAREHLRFFARIRGVPNDLIEKLCDHYISGLDLTLKCDTLTGTYSGGNKRKVSVALSLIANPDVVFLDEPSTGLDPITRQFLWRFLTQAKKDKAIVLTSHSMEEVDSLSSKIAIMVSGAIRAYGTSQELKMTHGTDFAITVRVHPSSKSRGKYTVLQALQRISPNAKMESEPPLLSSAAATNVHTRSPLQYLERQELKNKTIKEDEDEQQHQDYSSSSTPAAADDDDQGESVIRYLVPRQGTNLGSIFRVLQNLMNNQNLQERIVDFSVAQTSLEDVFVRFALMQEEQSHNTDTD